MSIRAVFRVQCDGPCRGWLCSPEWARPGMDVRHMDLVVEPTAERAGLWPGERAARTAALNNGWTRGRIGVKDQYGWRCPSCTENPLGIVLPPDRETDPDDECVCRHPRFAHNENGLCVKVPGVLGCGCLGFLDRRGENR